MDLLDSARALLLVAVANSTPWAVGRVFGRYGNLPLDLGYTLPDGKRLLGDHKTWRGLIAAVLVCGLSAELTGLSWEVGAGFGAMALLGDAMSSCIKRRMNFPPGAEVVGLDQLPEALLPLLIFARPLGVNGVEAVAIALSFLVFDVLVMRLRRST